MAVRQSICRTCSGREARLLYELHPNHGDTRAFSHRLLVILGTQQAMTPDAFKAWGWRIPFLGIDSFCNDFSLHPLRMKESPIFSQIKASGMTSAQPLKSRPSQNRRNLKRVLISLFGATAGQGVIWYTGQF